MFSFFTKQVYIKDHLEGLVDIHNHILPGIDDGAATVEDSISLIRKFSEMGITEFVATPHIMNDFYPNNPERIEEARQEILSALPEAGIEKIKIKAAAEYMMDQSFLELINKGNNLISLSENLVLVEMSYFQAPINLNEILFQLQTKKYKPVLAHPERYAFYHSRDLATYEGLKERGCLFQLNVLSLTGHYGKNIQEIAFRLLEGGMIDFIGTDTHQMRHLEKLSEAKISKKRIEVLSKVVAKTINTFRPSFY